MNAYELGVLVFLILIIAVGFYLTRNANMIRTVYKKTRFGKSGQSNNLQYVMVHFPELIDKVFLTDKYRLVLRHLIAGDSSGLTAAELSEEIDLTVGAARNRLRILFDKKYLGRRKAISKKAGAEYVYYPLKF